MRFASDIPCSYETPGSVDERANATPWNVL
jgi:hypothetical protein